MERRKTREVQVGSVTIGGGHPVVVQSMTNTKTEDAAATLAQIRDLQELGCEVIRCAVPTMEAAEALSVITKESPIPVIADIHFDYRLALAAIDAGVSALRLNPGNIGGPGRGRCQKGQGTSYSYPNWCQCGLASQGPFGGLRSSYGPCYGRSGLAAHPHP